jgi:hypothetical protein
MKKSDNLRRRPGFREPLARFLIVCEGEVTEPRYFRHLRLQERGLVEVKVVPGGVPKTVVELAVKLKKDAEAEAKRRKDANLRYDHVWCVFDIDEHPFVREAKHQARDNAIEVAVSNPCFELWLLLHFQKQTAHIERDRVAHLCRTHMPGYKKEPRCELLTPRQAEALTRAARLDDWQATRGNAGANPSTGVHHLVRQIKAARDSPTIETR